MAHPLDGAFAKLERAYQRICELHESINAFINADEPKPYLIRAERYNERTEERFIPTVTLGYRNIAVDDPIEPVQHVPHGVIATVGGSKRWPNLSKRRLWAIDPVLIAAFERLQPYHRRKRVHNDWLWVLEELWNGDKHHAVSVVLAYTALKHLYIIPLWIISNRAVSHKRGREVQDGTEITRMEFVWICTRRNQNYDPRMDVSAEFAMDVTFDPRSPIGRRRVVPVLLLIEKNVRSIVRKFRKCL